MMQRALASALEALAKLATAQSNHVAEARLILFTAAKMPSAALVEPLSSLESGIATNPPWLSMRPIVGALLDWLDPQRVMVGRTGASLGNTP